MGSEETPLCEEGIVDRWMGMQLSLQGPLVYVHLALTQQEELWACLATNPWGTSAVGGHQGEGKDLHDFPVLPLSRASR